MHRTSIRVLWIIYTIQMNGPFHKIAHYISWAVGLPWAFVGALIIVLIWAASGWFFDFSDTWQLLINTGTTILTFLMVFLIQNTQNRDTQAIHLKLNELIKAIDPARNTFIDVEDLSDKELETMAKEFRELRTQKAEDAAAK